MATEEAVADAEVDDAPDDLASLSSLDNVSVMSGVQRRFEQDRIYTRINTLLIAVNPYAALPIYGEASMAAHSAAALGTIAPHIYGTAAASYRGLLAGRSQSLVISGESGAGKSETAKKVLQYLAFAATAGSQAAEEGAQPTKEANLEARILATSPILEAFGNAKTSMNNNSSRYGKFLMLQFGASGRLVGARVNTYLLEKTRVVAPGLGERNYHACYMLCKARRLADGLQLRSAAELRYTGLTGCLDSPGWDDGAQLSLCEAAMAHVGVDAEAQGMLWRLLGALLLLGQLDFGEAEGLAEAQLAEPEVLQTFCDLLQLDCEPMQRALQIKMTKAGAEWIAQPLLPAKASELRHGLARTMYSALFDFLVAQINASLQIGEAEAGRAAPPPLATSRGGAALERQASAAGRAKSLGGAKMRGSAQDDETSRLLSAMQARNERFIGILDIFGFETFKVNSLEQLCINFCNERLQAAFNESVFAAVQEENAAEGIVLPAADLADVDNSEVVRLIGGKPGGVLHSLNEECIVPKGSDASFLGKLMDLHKDSPLLKRPTREQAVDALSFRVVHFVGPVVYSAHNLLMKNKDPVSQDLLVLLQHSRSPWVQSRFAAGGGSSGGGVSSGSTGAGSRRKDTRFKGVAAKFQQQLEELLALVGFSDPHFVRCVKPNQKKAARLFEPVMVETQLRCSGVFEAVRVIGMGYPDRVPHAHVHGNLALLLPAEERPAIDRHGTPEEGEKAAVQRVLGCLGVAADQFAVGFTKVFFRAGVLPGLRRRKEAADLSRAVTIQKFARRRLACTARKRLRVAREQREYLRREAERAEAERAEAARRAAEELRGVEELPIATGAPPVPGGSSTAGAGGEGGEGGQGGEGGGGGGAGGKPLGLNLGNLGNLGADLGSGAAKAGHAGRAPPLPLQRQGSDLRLDSEEVHRGLLSHRGGGGGGFAPLLSHRAPDRREVNKVAGLKQKTSQWLELVLEYAAYLGMDTEQDEELIWIAEQALRAPVPDGWEELMDPLGNLYFYNEGTMQTTRQHPMDGYYQSLYRKLRLQRTQAGGVAAGASRRTSTLSSRSSTLSGASGAAGGGGKAAGAATRRGGGGKGGAALGRRSSSMSGMLSARRGGSRPKPGGGPAGPAARTGAPRRGGGEASGRCGGGVEEADDLLEGSYPATPRTAGGGGGGYQQSVSISAAMEMATPRTAAFMLERFGLSPDAGEDERCLIVNPAFYLDPSEGGGIQRKTAHAPAEADKPRRAHAPGGASGRFSRRSSPSKAAPSGSRRLSLAAASSAAATPPTPTTAGAAAAAAAAGSGTERGFVECHLDKEELGMGMQSYTLSLGLHDGHEALALTAAKRVTNGNTQYQLGIVEDDGEEDVHPFTGKLSCDPKATNFVLYDDVNEAAGKGARRELGLVVFAPRQQGQLLPLELILPRVEAGGASAQFRPTKVSEALLSQYRAGLTRDLTAAKGAAHLVPGGKVVLRLRGGQYASVVFEAYRATGDRWAVRYRHPLSAYQAFAVAIAALHNPTSAMLDMLPPLDEVPHAPLPPAARDLACAATLVKGYGQVYCLAVHGARLFCGLRSGHVQLWHCPLNAPPVMHEWRAHSGCVYALLAVGRVLVTASQDALLRVWDLQSLHLLATLPGHKERVRCLAGGAARYPHRVFSGSNDRHVRVWDLSHVLAGGNERGQPVGVHSAWVRALAAAADGSVVVSASKGIRVWDYGSLRLLHSLTLGGWVYALACTDVTLGRSLVNTVYAGCADGLIRCWNMSDLNIGKEEHGQLVHGDGAVRALACHGAALYSGGADGRMRAWALGHVDLGGTASRLLRGGHTGAVRAIGVDVLTNGVYSAATDRTIKVWHEGAASQG